jgi:hypothetical protein
VQSGREIHRRVRGLSSSLIPGNQTTVFLTDAAINILKLQHLSLARNDKLQLTLRHMKPKSYFIIKKLLLRISITTQNINLITYIILT